MCELLRASHFLSAMEQERAKKLVEKAIQMLTKSELECLHHLFQLYNSSLPGDAMASINCRRFLCFCQDAGLINDTFTLEKVF